jgi:preprotein translocase subunit SecE
MADDPKNWFEGTKDYINELKLEMRRVTWPNRKQVQGTTAVVIISVFLFAGYHGGLSSFYEVDAYGSRRERSSGRAAGSRSRGGRRGSSCRGFPRRGA